MYSNTYTINLTEALTDENNEDYIKKIIYLMTYNILLLNIIKIN